VDDHGHPISLEYQGTAVPKKMNKLGSAGKPVPGNWWSPDPPDENAALERAQGNRHVKDVGDTETR
jgi:ubiquinol-cytochrome c reductase cytochrome b subunit